MQNKPVNRDNYTLCANQLREKFGPSYIIDCLYEKALAKGCNAVIESIRTPGEFYSLRQKGNFTLFAIDADPEIRYERIKQRNSETDQITFEDSHLVSPSLTSGSSSRNLCSSLSRFVFRYAMF